MTTPSYRREEVAVLYSRFDHLPHPARMRAIAEHTRSLDGSGYRAAHAALDAGDPDERHLALFLAVARHDLDAVSRALADPLLRSRALAAAIRLPVDEQALAWLVLNEIGSVRRHAYRILRLSRRSALADRLVAQVHERFGDEDTARLLPACTPQTAGQWLPRLSEVPSGILHALARTAPAAVAAHLADRLPADPFGPNEPRGLRRRSPYLVNRLTERDPASGMLLLERAPHLVTGEAAALLLRDPGAMVAALRRTGTERIPLSEKPLPRRVLNALAACDREDIALLARVLRIESRWTGPTASAVTPEPLLALLPPAERRCAVEFRLGDVSHVSLSEIGALAALAPADRAEIVTGWLAGRVRRRAGRRSLIAALLPPAEAEPLLREGTGAHRPFERASAWPALLACAALHGDPETYARILTSCERAWHDQEMVRRAALGAAGSVPDALLGAAPITALRDAAMTTTQSRDSNAATLATAEHWLRRTVVDAARAGDQGRAAAVIGLLTQVLADPRGSGSVRPLPLGRDAAVGVWERCRAQSTSRSARFHGLIGALLVRQLPHLPTLDVALGRAALEGPRGEPAERAAALWLADPATREQRCARLLAVDPAAAVVPAVWDTVARRRTDLLDTAIGPDLPPQWAPRMRRSVLGRWLPRQRALLDAHLARTTLDDEVPLRERTDAVALLGDSAGLRALADTAPQPVAAAALAALGERAAESGGVRAHPRTLEFLLGRAGTGGVRGRAAMSGVRTLLGTAPDGEAVVRFASVVRDVASSVGSRKAAVHGLAALSSPDAFTAVLAGWDAPGQHRDVHATMADILAVRMDVPGVAERLAGQLHHPAVGDRVMAARPERALAADALRRFLAHTLATAEADTAHAAARALRGPAHATDRLRAVVAAVVCDADRPHGVRSAAAELLCEWATTVDGRSSLVTALDEVVGQARSTDGEYGQRRTALRVLDSLNRRYHGPCPIGALDAVTEALRAAGLLHSASEVALLAAVSSLEAVDEAAGVWHRWERWLELAGDRPGCRDVLGQLWRGPGGVVPVAAIRPVVAALRAHGAAAAGLAALCLVVRAGDSTRWAQPWPAELAALRGSAYADVAEAALLADIRRPLV
ncbi:hypothetical protein LRD69_05375 [Streptomyces sp. JH14]|uniref:hypothetical protein n=1 Tax=Streptomyces sp. JH14 TaxID=2793630 RepID=UPI0023F88AEE|nr:hypothetical protein [Streptomyces sp. JH14]MDF6041598.1 hypothetical protein [Streptomyces sp. JH14]